MSEKILIVDAANTERDIIKEILANYHVLTACDAQEAMQHIENNPDLALTLIDLDLPDMEGFQLLACLNADSRFRGIRTIILTNADELKNEAKGLQVGAVDYLRKPLQEASLKTRIEMHLEMIKQEVYKQRLHHQKLTFDAIFWQAPVGIAISFGSKPLLVDSNTYFSINPRFEEITGRTKEELFELGWSNITHPDDLELDLQQYEQLLAGKITSYSLEKRYLKPDGSIVWVFMVVASLVLSNQHQYNHISLIQDITDRKLMENHLWESERSKSVLLSHLPGLAYRCENDWDWTMQFVSAGCSQLTGYPPESLIHNRDLSFADLIAPEYRDLLRQEWERVLAQRGSFRYEYEIITAVGERKWVLEMGEGVYDAQGSVEALEGIIIDIEDRKNMENDLKYNYEHDRLTGLHNRNYLENLLKRDAETGTAENQALASVNLSTLQPLTLTYGFHYVQELTKKVADKLNVMCTHNCMLFYTYESRFAFYLQDYAGRDALNGFCETVAQTLESLLAIERVGGGIGVIEIDKENELDIDQLLKNLLIASERAIDIDDREFAYCFFSTEMEA